MSRGCVRVLAVMAALAVAVGYLVYKFNSGAVGAPIHIAVVGPMTGGSPENGRAFVEGTALVVDAVNREGGIDGHRIVLDVYDDQNQQELAAAAARKIVEDGRAIFWLVLE